MAIALGFIGAGNINKLHLASAKELGAKLGGLTDIHEPHGKPVAEKFGIERLYTDYRQMLADKTLDAIVIGVPNRLHAEMAIAALQAGKHVFLEKPMAMNVRECDAILAARDKAGKVLQIGMVNRFRGATQALKKFIDAGRCGKISAGQAFLYRRRGIPGFGGWFTTRSESGGGALIDIGVHLLDLSLYLMGFPKPTAVSGMTYNVWKKLEHYTYTSMWGKPTPGGTKDVDDYALALIRFEDGQTLQLNVSWALNVDFMSPDSSVRLMGEAGGVELRGLEHAHLYTEEAGHLVDVKAHYTPNDPMLDEMAHFLANVEHNRQPMPTGEQGRTVQSILDAIYRSSAENREVAVE